MFCASNQQDSPPVYLLTPDFTAEHIVELTQSFQRSQIPYVLQKETDTLGLPLDRRYFVVVDNIKGTVVLGVQFSSLLIYSTQDSPQKSMEVFKINKQRAKYFDLPEQLIYQLHKLTNKTVPVKLKQKQSKTNKLKRKIEWAEDINNQQAETPIFQSNAVHNNSQQSQHTVYSKSQNNIGEMHNQFSQHQSSRISKTQKRLPTLVELNNNRNSRILNQIEAEYYQTNSNKSQLGGQQQKHQKSIKKIVHISKVKKDRDEKNDEPPSVVDLEKPKLAKSSPVVQFPTASDCTQSCLNQRQQNLGNQYHIQQVNKLTTAKPSPIKLTKLQSVRNIVKNVNQVTTKKSIRKVKRAKTQNPINFSSSQLIGQMFELVQSGEQKAQKIDNIMVSATAPAEIIETITRHIYQTPLQFPTKNKGKLLRRPYVQPQQYYLPFSPSSSGLLPIKADVKRKLRSISHSPQIKFSHLSSIVRNTEPQFHSIVLSDPKIPPTIAKNQNKNQQQSLGLDQLKNVIKAGETHLRLSTHLEAQTFQLTPASSSGFWGPNGKKIQSNMLQSTFNGTESSAQQNLCIESKYTQSMNSSNGFFKAQTKSQRKPSSVDYQIQTGNCYNPSVFSTFGNIRSNVNQEGACQRSSIISSKGQSKLGLNNNRIYNMAKTMPSNLSFAQSNPDSLISHKLSQTASMYKLESSTLSSNTNKTKSKIKHPLCILHKQSKQIMNQLNSAINTQENPNNKYNSSILKELKQNLRQHEFQNSRQISKIMQYLPNNSQIMLIASSSSIEQLYQIIQQVKNIQVGFMTSKISGNSCDMNNKITHIFLNSLAELSYQQQQQIRDKLHYNCVLLPPLRPPQTNTCRGSRVSSLAKTRNRNIADRLLSVLCSSVSDE